MIRKIPVDILFLGTALDHRPDIGFPGQTICTIRAKVSKNTLAMVIESINKGARDHKESATESPADVVGIKFPTEGPASWDRHLLKGATLDFLYLIDKSLRIL